MIGEILSHYEVLEKLGEGGMGAVYKARDPRLDRLVAIKVLPAAMQGDDEARDGLQSEARAASALAHPNICTIHDFGETPDGLVFTIACLSPICRHRSVCHRSVRMRNSVEGVCE